MGKNAFGLAAPGRSRRWAQRPAAAARLGDATVTPPTWPRAVGSQGQVGCCRGFFFYDLEVRITAAPCPGPWRVGSGEGGELRRGAPPWGLRLPEPKVFLKDEEQGVLLPARVEHEETCDVLLHTLADSPYTIALLAPTASPPPRRCPSRLPTDPLARPPARTPAPGAPADRSPPQRPAARPPARPPRPRPVTRASAGPPGTPGRRRRLASERPGGPLRCPPGRTASSRPARQASRGGARCINRRPSGPPGR